jgi:ketosteroid isomerase-like protein
MPGQTVDDPIKAPHELFVDGCTSGKVDRIVTLLDDDCVFMPTNETTLYGREEAREWFDEYYRDFTITSLTPSERDVTLMGEWALERWAYTVAIVPVKGGERIRDDGRWVMLWKQNSEGDWKITQLIFNSIRPIGSGTSKFMVRMMDRRKAGKSD